MGIDVKAGIAKYKWSILLCLIFVIAIVLRVKTYFLARPLWHDECSLAWSVLTRNFLGFFKPLENEQKAPVLFMMLSKMVTIPFGIREISIKLVSFLSGLGSIVGFYFLSKKVLEKNWSIAAANFLFAINYQLIYWGQKFKQYSFDVFVMILSLLIFTKIDLDNLNYQKCLIFSLLSTVLVMASFPCVFIVCGFVLFSLINKRNFKKILTYVLPIAGFGIFYYIKSLYGEQSNEVSSYLQYWDLGFLKLNIFSFLIIIKENFDFFFVPNKFALLGTVLFFAGLVLSVKSKNKTGIIAAFAMLAALVCSFLKIYPIWQRTALYLLPLAILFISKPLDFVWGRKILGGIIVCIFLLNFSKYNFSYLTSFLRHDAFVTTDAITTFPQLVKEYKSGDILVDYSAVYGFKPQKGIYIPINRFDDEYYYNVLKSLPKGTYWFILGWEYSHDSKFRSVPNALYRYIHDNHIQAKSYKNNESVLIKLTK
jgi:hypothetical protein